jgi:hypothetical protein
MIHARFGIQDNVLRFFSMGDFLDRAIRELCRYVALTTVTSRWYSAIRKFTLAAIR